MRKGEELNLNRKYLLFLIFFPLCLSLAQSAEENSLDAFSIKLKQEISAFEKSCIGKEDELLRNKILITSLTDCETEATYLEGQINLYQKAVIEDEEIQNLSFCNPQSESPELLNLIGIVEKVTPKVNCTQEEVSQKEKSCANVWACNALRSVFKVSKTMLPSILVKPVRRYVKEKSEAISGGCLDEGKSDCLQELVNTLVGSLLDTGEALWDLAKAGVSSLFDVGGWFSSKSESMHAAAVQNTQSVKGFLDSPGEWIMNLLNSMSSSINKWVKSSVLCQDWSGEPHLSECVTPLASYDCIDCETKVNAVCSVAGAVISEVGIMALTAGAGNIASIGVRAGAATMKAVAKKAAKKIKIKSPKVSMKIRESKIMKVPVVSGIVSTGLKATRVTAVVAKEKLEAIKGFLDKVQKSRGVQAAKRISEKTLDIVADPTRVGKVIAEKTFMASTKTVAKVGPKGMSKLAKEDLTLINKARLSGGKGKEVIKDKTRPSKLSSTVKIDKGLKALKGNHHGGVDSKKDKQIVETNNDTLNYDKKNYGTDQPPRRQVEVADQKHHDSKSNKNEDEQSTSGPGLAAAFAGVGPQGLSNKTKWALGSGGVALDISAKLPVEQESDEPVEEDISDVPIQGDAQWSQYNKKSSSSKGKSDVAKDKKGTGPKSSGEMRAEIEKRIGSTEVSSEKDLFSALGISDDSQGEDTSEIARRKVESLGNIYSEGNRKRMVQRLQKENTRLDENDANKLFNQRQAQIQSANKFLKNTQSRPSEGMTYDGPIDNHSSVKRVKNQKVVKKNNVSSELLNQELAELREQISNLDKNGTKKTPRKSTKDKTVVDNYRTRKPKSLRENDLKFNKAGVNSVSGTRAPASLNGFHSYREKEKDSPKEIGTYHPDVLDRLNKENENGKAPQETQEAGMNLVMNEEPRESKFNELNDLFGTEPSKASLIEKKDVIVNIDLAKVQSGGDVAQLLAFKEAINRFKTATSLNTIQKDNKTYSMYKFVNKSRFGVLTLESGEKRLLSEKEIKSIFLR